MCLTIKLFVDYRGYEAGRVVTMSANTAFELLKSGKARIAERGEM